MSLFHVSPKRGRQFCNVVVVICGRRRSTAATNAGESANGGARRFAEEESSRSVREFKEAAARRNFEVLEPSGKEELQQRLEILQPTVVYFCTDIYSTKHDFGSLVIGDSEVCSADDIALLFRGKLPNLVCLEISESFKLGEGLCSKGIPYVVAWKAYLTAAIVTSFRQAFLPALQCTGSELWDAFQVSKAAFQLHCIQPNPELSRNGKQKVPSFLPVLLGKSPKVTFNHLALKDTSEEGIKSIAPGAIQIFEDPTEIRLLLSDRIGTEETVFLPALQDGLNALLTAEVRSVRLMHRMSAPLPPAAASALVRGMVTMRCDVCTSNFARISFIVSGSAEICLKDEFLEHCIRMELASRSQFLQFVTSLDCGSALRPGMLGTSCIASGASTVEASIKTSAWAGQILRQLALQSSYLNLVSLGVAGVDGVSVAAFQTRDSGIGAMPKSEEDREQYSKREYESATGSSLPTWLSTPPPRRKRTHIVSDGSVGNDCNELDGSCRNQIFSLTSEDPTISGRDRLTTGMASSGSSRWKRQCLLAKLKPVPHSNKVKLMPFGTFVGGLPTSNARKPSVVNGGVGKGHHFNGSSSPTAAANDGNYPGAAVVPPQHALALGCSATRKHGCVRPSLEECTEEEFLEDLMQFLVSRGHGRLIPTTGIDAFPNVVLNGKKLDLYNLYREVVTRGGFYVGNGINWKGQIFPKMRNHTLTNRITGVGNTLKRHYETYLLEYELAHDDVGGECCVLCFSGAEGDWVNCGVCRQWAHFGCDRRTGLGAFKDYAKTDGLEYICPRCSIRVMPRAKDGDRPR